MHLSRFVPLLILFVPASLFAKAPAAFHYLPPDSVAIQSVLSGPPAPGSPENQADIQAVLSRQQVRTQSEIVRVRSEENLTAAAFADVFGNWFTPAKLPLTFALLNNASNDAHAIAAQAKQFWRRPRPPLQDPAIHPIVALPATASYPSFHAARGALWATILASLAPDLKVRILARGAQIGEDRVIAGVHFPTDVQAGQKLGAKLAARFLTDSPAFRRDLDLAKAEFSAVRPKSAAQFSKPRLIYWDETALAWQ